ncbi:hypothetical protein DOY81_014245, partial [Sarcophaga bullata]
KVEPIEEAFLSVIVYRPDGEQEKANKFTNDVVNAFSSLPQDSKEGIIRQYLEKAASASNTNQLKVLMSTLGKLTESHLITAKLLCDKILLCEK